MPLHRLYHPEGLFDSVARKRIAELVVVFISVPADSIFVGGEPAKKFVRVVSQHLARTMPTLEKKAEAVKKLEEALAPEVRDKGIDWEIHIEEQDKETWRFNGIVPPMAGSEAEKMWAKENRAVPY